VIGIEVRGIRVNMVIESETEAAEETMVIVEMITTDLEGSFCIKIDNVFRFIGVESVSRSRYRTGLDFLSESAICPEELPSIFVFFQYDSKIICSLTISRQQPHSRDRHILAASVLES